MKEVRYKRLYIVWFYLYEMFRIGKFIEIESSGCIVERRVIINGFDIFFGNYGNVWKLDCGIVLNLLKFYI